MLQTARRLNAELHRGMKQIMDSIAGKTKDRWQDKKKQGQFTRNFEEKLVGKEQSY
jgi:hypothetical protein